jgi:hypothetical protein
MIFVGYERGSKAFKAYNPRTGRVHVARDVIFDEGGQWDWSGDAAHDDMARSDANDFTVQYMVSPASSASESEDSAAPAASATSPTTPAEPSSPATPMTMTTSSSGSALAIQFASPPTVLGEDELDADHDDDLPPRFRKPENIVGLATTPGLAVRDLDSERLLAVSAEEPALLAQAKQEACWRRAMEEELRSIEENRTWTLTELPQGRRAIGLKWVFKVKKDEHGAVVRHKARLVVKGYAQRHGIDYDEVFAPVARMEAVRLLLALAAHEGWEVHHMDVKTAFLNGDLQEEVFVVQAPGFAQPGQEHKVFKLHKALYGLHQAPRA